VVEVVDNSSERRYEALLDGQVVKGRLLLDGNVITLQHHCSESIRRSGNRFEPGEFALPIPEIGDATSFRSVHLWPRTSPDTRKRLMSLWRAGAPTRDRRRALGTQNALPSVVCRINLKQTIPVSNHRRKVRVPDMPRSH
jgi:hypothetical protein